MIRSIFTTAIITFVANFSFAQTNEELKFNHLYFVVDSVTYDAILNDETLFENFADIDIGLPDFKKADSTATILYVRGENTYIEIMAPNNKFGVPAGNIGLGFSWDTKIPFDNDLSNKTIFESEKIITFDKHDMKRKFEDGEILWFSSFYTKPQGNLASWYAFYNPEFLTRLFKRPYTTYSRNDFLKNVYDSNKKFIDIKEISLHCTEDDFNRIKRELHVLGCKVLTENEQVISYQCADVVITLLSDNSLSQSKIGFITLKTNTSEEKIYQFGHIHVKQGINETSWSF